MIHWLISSLSQPGIQRHLIPPQTFVKQVTNSCRYGIFFLVSVDILLSITLLIRTYSTSESLRLSLSWNFLFVGSMFCNAQVSDMY